MPCTFEVNVAQDEVLPMQQAHPRRPEQIFVAQFKSCCYVSHDDCLCPELLCIVDDSARKWDDALREAKQDLSFDRRTKYVRGGDSAPPRLSVGGFRSLNTLLRQRARADRVSLSRTAG